MADSVAHCGCRHCGSYAEAGMSYYGSEHFGVYGAGVVCEQCLPAARAVEAFCTTLPVKIARYHRRMEIVAMKEIVLAAIDEDLPVEDYVGATRCLRVIAEMAMGDR